MPIIRPISDLRNHADKIEKICHKWHEPVFITKNGRESMVLMSQAFYELEFARKDLIQKLNEGEESLRKNPKGVPYQKVLKDLRKKIQ